MFYVDVGGGFNLSNYISRAELDEISEGLIKVYTEQKHQDIQSVDMDDFIKSFLHLKIEYAHFAEVAREEGFDDIARVMDGVAKIEKRHEERYRQLLENIKNEMVFERDEEVAWECMNCGHVHYGKKAPGLCPVCKHPGAYFMIEPKNF